ncbi:hypothetical protein ACJW31_02G140700 [Castanea mollissima]
MMEGSDSWILRLVACFLFLLVQSTCAQEGFVSLACCADSNFIDQNISWSPDDSWFPDRTGCRNETKAAVNNDQGYNKTRVFNIPDLPDSGKRCYNLTTVKDQDYLVRGTFLYGDLLSTNPNNSFNVLGIFRATEDHIDFCLEKDIGNPYISKVELRPLKISEYLQESSSTVLKLVSRVDVGGTGAIRYPHDESDRIWQPSTNSTATITSSFSVNVTNYTATNVNAPLRVLQTALDDSERLEFHEDHDKVDSGYRVFLYFLELNENVKPGQRMFDIYINNLRIMRTFDILANGSNYREVVWDFMANGSLNLTLSKASGSAFGLICNAYEILQRITWVQETNQKDVDVISKARNELLVYNQANKLLDTWSGDPCVPHTWLGLFCETYNGSIIITDVQVQNLSSRNLSSSKLQGLIPPSITELANIITLNLSNNHFNGTIPEFHPYSMLTSVDISNNELVGQIPESLTSLPYLKFLFFGCNSQLDKGHSFKSSTLNTDDGKCDTGKNISAILIGTVACGSFLLTVVVGIILCQSDVVIFLPSKDDMSIKSISIEPFTLEYIETITKKYKTLIGEGGFGSVYRGTILDGQEVAVKVRSAMSTQGTREFENELNLLSEIRHENLVPLLGYCSEKDQQILVYPFMSNGSLQDRLYGEPAKRKFLDWPTRLSIALGAARGLTYLYTFPGRNIIHWDVKSSNILLDHSMCAKDADFGFSKYAPQEGDSNASLEVRGTVGYLDPEYYTTQQLSAKSDVFSFGVVLLEIVSGREPLNILRPRNEWSLVEWAKSYFRESRIDEIVDPGIKGGYHAEAMWRVMEVALSCIESYAAYRPCMIDIIRELEDALIIENNASEYMKSIDSLTTSNSNRFSLVLDKRILIPPISTPTETSPIMTQALSPPQPK